MPNFEVPQSPAEKTEAEKEYLPPHHGELKDITPEIIQQNLDLLRSIDRKKGVGLIESILKEPDEMQAALKINDFRNFYRDVVLEMHLDMAQVLRKIIALRRLRLKTSRMRATEKHPEPSSLRPPKNRETAEGSAEKKETDPMLEKHLNEETLEFLEKQGFTHLKRTYREGNHEITEFIFFPDTDSETGRHYLNTLSWGRGLYQSRVRFNQKLSGRPDVKLGSMSSLEYPTAPQVKVLLEHGLKEKLKENLPDIYGDKLFAVYTMPPDLKMLEGKERTFVWEKMEEKGNRTANLSKIAEGATRSDVHVVSLPVLTLRIKSKA